MLAEMLSFSLFGPDDNTATADTVYASFPPSVLSSSQPRFTAGQTEMDPLMESFTRALQAAEKGEMPADDADSFNDIEEDDSGGE